MGCEASAAACLILPSLVALPDRADVTIEVLLDDGWHRRMPNNDGEIIDEALSAREITGRPGDPRGLRLHAA